jgi:hypothetical protein
MGIRFLLAEQRKTLIQFQIFKQGKSASIMASATALDGCARHKHLRTGGKRRWRTPSPCRTTATIRVMRPHIAFHQGSLQKGVY